MLYCPFCGLLPVPRDVPPGARGLTGPGAVAKCPCGSLDLVAWEPSGTVLVELGGDGGDWCLHWWSDSPVPVLRASGDEGPDDVEGLVPEGDLAELVRQAECSSVLSS